MEITQTRRSTTNYTASGNTADQTIWAKAKEIIISRTGALTVEAKAALGLPMKQGITGRI